jgi:hypothetical protein
MVRKRRNTHPWVRPSDRNKRKAFIDAYLKKWAHEDLESGEIKDDAIRELVRTLAKAYRRLGPYLREKPIWPDDKLPAVVKTNLRALKIAAVANQYGRDSPEFDRVCALMENPNDLLVVPQLSKLQDWKRNGQEELKAA